MSDIRRLKHWPHYCKTVSDQAVFFRISLSAENEIMVQSSLITRTRVYKTLAELFFFFLYRLRVLIPKRLTFLKIIPMSNLSFVLSNLLNLDLA